LFGQIDVERVWRRGGTACRATSLRLEITESVLMDHGGCGAARLVELRALGVCSFVDFGTGSPSPSYLQLFFTTLKIDRSFYRRCRQG
jgi:EAL domain-containing protein (putative c-di-GMP-specific phosphodiesterase class I)